MRVLPATRCLYSISPPGTAWILSGGNQASLFEVTPPLLCCREALNTSGRRDGRVSAHPFVRTAARCSHGMAIDVEKRVRWATAHKSPRHGVVCRGNEQYRAPASLELEVSCSLAGEKSERLQY